MEIIDSIKTFFAKKDNNETTDKAPKGVCPNCWGTQEWENEYYKFKKGSNGNYNNDTYDTFIMKVVRKVGTITLKGNEYICEICSKKNAKTSV